MPTAVKENEVETYLRHKWLHGLILLHCTDSRYLELHFARYFIPITYVISFAVKRNQKSLQSLYSEVLLNFINYVEKFRTECEKGDEKTIKCSQLGNPRLYGFPLTDVSLHLVLSQLERCHRYTPFS